MMVRRLRVWGAWVRLEGYSRCVYAILLSRKKETWDMILSLLYIYGSFVYLIIHPWDSAFHDAERTRKR